MVIQELYTKDKPNLHWSFQSQWALQKQETWREILSKLENNVFKSLVPNGTQHNWINEFFLVHPFFRASIFFKITDAPTSCIQVPANIKSQSKLWTRSSDPTCISYSKRWCVCHTTSPYLCHVSFDAIKWSVLLEGTQMTKLSIVVSSDGGATYNEIRNWMFKLIKMNKMFYT